MQLGADGNVVERSSHEGVGNFRGKDQYGDTAWTAGYASQDQGGRTGTWTEIIDSETADTPWGSVGLTASTPPLTSVRLRVRASNDRGLLGSLSFLEVPAGANPTGVRGRYMEVEVTLRSEETVVTPSAFAVAAAAVLPPTVAFTSPIDGSQADAGRTIVLSGRATVSRPTRWARPVC